MSRVMLIVGAPLALAADVPLARMLRRARPRPFGLTVPAVMPAMVSSAEADGSGDGVFSPVPAVQVPADGFKQSERQIVAAGHDYLVPVISRGVYEALRFTADATVITAVARMGFPERLQFDVIEDLEPYLVGRKRFFLSWLRFWER